MVKKKTTRKKKEKILPIVKRLSYKERDKLKEVCNRLDAAREVIQKLSAELLALSDIVAPYYVEEDSPF